jgi:succinyl-diaminopimelate desuccinylase
MKKLLKKLIEAESTSSTGELAVAKVISDELKHSKITCKIDEWGKNRANVIAHMKNGKKNKALLFACHTDVVPAGEGWDTVPFKAVEKQGKIFGRGSTDMKGGIAAIVTAIKEIAESDVKLNGDIILAGAAGEETDSCGAERFVSKFNKQNTLAGVIIPEPTDFDIVIAHRGLLWLQVSAKGKAAHGSTPHLGINAITLMRQFLDELDKYKFPVKPHKLLGSCSMSINTMETGKAINIVPDKCTTGIDIRTLPGQNHHAIISDMKKIFARLKKKNPQFDAEISIVRDTQALETSPSCDFVKSFCCAVNIDETKAVGFTTDGSVFAQIGDPIVIFGPGKPGVCHKANEFIEIADVEKAVEYYKRIILKFLG